MDGDGAADPDAGNPPGAPGDAGAVDVAHVTERVYQLMLEDVRLERARRGAGGTPRGAPVRR